MQKLIWKRIDPKRSMCPKISQCHQQEWSENEECVKATKNKSTQRIERISKKYSKFIKITFPILPFQSSFQKFPKTLSIIRKRMDDDREKGVATKPFLSKYNHSPIPSYHLEGGWSSLVSLTLAQQGMESVLTECKDSWMERR